MSRFSAIRRLEVTGPYTETSKAAKPPIAMPYTGIVLTIVALAAGVFLIPLCHWLVAAGLFPKTVSHFEHEYGRRPVRATLVGLLTLGPILLLLSASGGIGHPGVRLVVWTIGLGAVLAALFGSAGLALRVGNGLCPEASKWQRMQRGGSMLSLCFLVPLIGWFFVLPVTLCSGFGVFLLAKPWKSEAGVMEHDETPAPSASL
jgi:hypothetical protein